MNKNLSALEKNILKRLRDEELLKQRIRYQKRKEAGTNKQLIPLDQQKKRGRKPKADVSSKQKTDPKKTDPKKTSPIKAIPTSISMNHY